MSGALEALKLLTTGGRKMTVTVTVNVILGILGLCEIVILKKTPELCYWMLASTNGFFFGLNVIGDHFLTGKKL